jgi:hypothetical protein
METTVCSLSSDERRERRAMLQREIAPHVRRTTELANGLAWEFDRNAAVRAKLLHLIDLERRCCGGLAWSLEESPEARNLRLVVTGVDPRSELFAGFHAAGMPRTEGALARALRATGFGVGAALLVCCILPGAVALVAGAAVAAPLARLDDPVAIGTASVGAAALSWLWMRRRARSCAC